MEAVTTTATAKQGQLSHFTKPTALLQITTPRQARLLQAILTEPKTTLELEQSIVKCRNIWQVCFQLRRIGWNIQTITEPFTDQDGQRSKITWYLLDASQIPSAQTALDAFKTKQQNKKMGNNKTV